MEEIKIEPRLSVQQWVGLSQDIRFKLHDVFGLHRSTSAEVNGGQLVCDGHSYNDLSAITLEKMNAYLGAKQKDFFEAFKACIDKAGQPEAVEEPKVEEKPAEAIVEPNKDYIPPKPSEEALNNMGAKRGRPAKK